MVLFAKVFYTNKSKESKLWLNLSLDRAALFKILHEKMFYVVGFV